MERFGTFARRPHDARRVRRFGLRVRRFGGVVTKAMICMASLAKLNCNMAVFVDQQTMNLL